jgi:SAM-dependent methyltransferase
MEINKYLGLRYRILSDPNHQINYPEIISSFAKLSDNELIELDKLKSRELYLNHQYEDLYQDILLAQLSQLHKVMPQVFYANTSYINLVIPFHLLLSNSVRAKLVNQLSENIFLYPENLGLLCQYFENEQRDIIRDKITNKKYNLNQYELISLTQLCTTPWIAKFMLENSLGQLWLEVIPNSILLENSQYYLENNKNLIIPNYNETSIDPINLTVLDPSCGSGTLLVEAYRILKQIYLEYGYSIKEIPQLILKHNIFGFDIDPKICKLANFNVIMMALADDNNLLSQPLITNIISLKSSNNINRSLLVATLSSLCISIQEKQFEQFLDLFINANLYGSLIQIPKVFQELTYNLQPLISNMIIPTNLSSEQLEVITQFKKLIQQSILLANTYDCVVSRPPHINSNTLSKLLGSFNGFLKNTYPQIKPDLVTAFILRNLLFTKPNGYLASYTLENWMFLASFENFRDYLLSNSTIDKLIYLPNTRKMTFKSCVTILRNKYYPEFEGAYCHITPDDLDVEDTPNDFSQIIDKQYFSRAQKFRQIPGIPIAYWVTDKIAKIMQEYPNLAQFSNVKTGVITGNNAKFTRYWHEVDYTKIGFNLTSNIQAEHSCKKWVPMNKGGEFRKWYGIHYFVINYENDGAELKQYSNISSNQQYFFNECATWTGISLSYFGIRYLPYGFINESTGSGVFTNSNNLYSIVGFLSSNLVPYFFSFINPTLYYKPSDVAILPTKLIPECESIVKELITISKQDWDSFEISWNFKTHPLLQIEGENIEKRYQILNSQWQLKIQRMQFLEQENNRLHINAYDLNDEFNPEVEIRYISLNCNPYFRYRTNKNLEDRLKLDTYKELISYLIGCILGRYSLDYDGIAYAGGMWYKDRYQTYIPTPSKLIPLTNELFYSDDGARQLEKIVKQIFHIDPIGSFRQLAQIIKSSTENSLIILNNYLINGFYKDHLKTYQKRPIYWLFSSGKTKAFQALVYLHCLDIRTLIAMRLDYVYPLLDKLQVRLSELESLPIPIQSQIRQINELNAKIIELEKFLRNLEYVINTWVDLDLDEGVIVNYAKFKDILEPIS